MNARSITYLLLWLSKTDPILITFCPKPVLWSRTALGFFVLATGLFAFITGNQFIQTMFVGYVPSTGETHIGWMPKLLSYIIGGFWAIFIIMLDREIVSASSKWGAAIRLPLALALGFAIAIPMKMMVFQERILKQLTLNSQDENAHHSQQLYSAEDNYNDRIKKAEDKRNEARAQMERWSSAMEAETVGRKLPGRTGRLGQGAAYKEALKNFELHQKFENQYQAELQELIANKENALQSAEDRYENSRITQTYDFPSQYEALSDLSEQNKHIGFLAFLITLIFMLIEIVPAILKLLKGSDEYDALLEVRTNIARQMAYTYGNIAIDELQNVKDINTLKQHNYPYSPKEIIHSITLNLA